MNKVQYAVIIYEHQWALCCCCTYTCILRAYDGWWFYNSNQNSQGPLLLNCIFPYTFTQEFPPPLHGFCRMLKVTLKDRYHTVPISLHGNSCSSVHREKPSMAEHGSNRSTTPLTDHVPCPYVAIITFNTTDSEELWIFCIHVAWQSVGHKQSENNTNAKGDINSVTK